MEKKPDHRNNQPTEMRNFIGQCGQQRTIAAYVKELSQRGCPPWKEGRLVQQLCSAGADPEQADSWVKTLMTNIQCGAHRQLK